MSEDVSKVIGLEGGKDGTWFRILAEQERGETTYHVAIKDGQVARWSDFPTLDDYMAHLQPRTRITIRLVVAGNPVAAEDVVSAALGCECLAVAPNTLDVYPDEPPWPTFEAAAATLGRRGGSRTSERKTQAARENGKRGGRPRKQA